eukprot:3585466-Pyramimonas_sp.AAC.1
MEGLWHISKPLRGVRGSRPACEISGGLWGGVLGCLGGLPRRPPGPRGADSGGLGRRMGLDGVETFQK